MNKNKAILKREKLIVYSPDYEAKIVKAGETGEVIENDKKIMRAFCIHYGGKFFSARVEIGEFEYIDTDKEQEHIDKLYKVKNYKCDSLKKDNLYSSLLLLVYIFKSKTDLIIEEDFVKRLLAKTISTICSNEYFKFEKLPIPYNSKTFLSLIGNWYKNEVVFEEEEYLLKILQNLLYMCESNNIDINKLFD